MTSSVQMPRHQDATLTGRRLRRPIFYVSPLRDVRTHIRFLDRALFKRDGMTLHPFYIQKALQNSG